MCAERERISQIKQSYIKKKKIHAHHQDEKKIEGRDTDIKDRAICQRIYLR